MIENKNIIIKNIYYMLSYAFSILKKLDDKNIDVENFKDIHNMFAAILSKGIGTQLKRGLYREYITKHENLPLLRGKLDISGTIQNKISQKTKLSCEYDELSENNIFNQILKSTVTLLLKNENVDPEYKIELRKEMLFFANVDEIDLNRIQWNTLKFQKNNQMYRMLISICQLIIEGMILTNHKGEIKLASFIDEQRMCRLYEKFILEYYKKHYAQLSPKVTQIKWALDEGIGTMLPAMKTDITLQKDNNVLIIDAKYYSHMTQIQYDKHSIHSNNLYQVFTYVKNKHYEFGDEEHKVSGVLLYAQTNEGIKLDEKYKIHNSNIAVKALDLGQDFSVIKEQLNKIVEEYFDLEG